MWKLALALFLCASTASAGIDELFPEGALGVVWGATLQQVEAAHPGGLAWPARDSQYDSIVYAVPGQPQMLGLGAPVKLVQFVFTRDNKLRTIVFHFTYSDRDAALYQAGELLGHDYSVKDEAMARQFRWKPGRATEGVLAIGTSALQPWVHLGLQARKTDAAARK